MFERCNSQILQNSILEKKLFAIGFPYKHFWPLCAHIRQDGVENRDKNMFCRISHAHDKQMTASPANETVLVPSCFIFTVTCSALDASGQIFILGRYLWFCEHSKTWFIKKAHAFQAFIIVHGVYIFGGLINKFAFVEILFLCTPQKWSHTPWRMGSINWHDRKSKTWRGIFSLWLRTW